MRGWKNSCDKQLTAASSARHPDLDKAVSGNTTGGGKPRLTAT
jgi:hypothetical protein